MKITPLSSHSRFSLVRKLLSGFTPLKAYKLLTGFTLLELLIVIGIIGALTAITVLILNPVRYLQQSRDGRRFSELQTINKALSLIKTANTNITYFGEPSRLYVSLPDPALSGNATSTCPNMNLPFVSGWTYHCVSSGNLQKTNGLGWLPVNFASSTVGSFAVLPIDPVNAVTNNQFYAYTAEPAYELTAYLESEKYAPYAQTDGGDDNYRYELGTGGSPAIGVSVGGPAPSLASVSPSGQWNDETVSVSISGSSFVSGATAKIGTTNLTSVVVVNSTTIIASVPTGITAGTYNVVVTNPDTQLGTLTNGWTSTVPVYLSGNLSGLYNYASNQKAVVNGNVAVSAYNGTDNLTSCDASETGCLQINAGKIVVNSGITVDASGKGGGGGDGGAGGSRGGNGSPGGNGNGGFGGSGGGGGSGRWWDDGPPDSGGYGNNGGYAVTGGQGDSSIDSSLNIGSGGGGGGGAGSGSGTNCWWGYSGGGGGGAGNYGGGYIKLIAIQSLTLSGSVLTSGKSSAAGNGGNGGDCEVLIDCPSPGGYGGSGGSSLSSGSSSNGLGGNGASYCYGRNYNNGGLSGSGAGGGVLLQSPAVTINAGATVDARGGGSATTNGGTVKIFTDSFTNSGSVYRGRLCQGIYSGSCGTQ